MINDLGYEVVTATDGVEALALLRSDPSIDLLFTDIVMPGGITGIQLAQQALKASGDLQALLTSGYPAKGGSNAAATDFSLITKPYKQEQLARMLRVVLDRRTRLARSISGR
jgi:CheY-like chemotaxis protein